VRVYRENPRTRSREFRLLLFLAILALGLAGLTACDDDPGKAPNDDTFEYVALGDSFTATGIGVPHDATGCKRSKQNYPRLIARAHPDWVLDDVSCGGASSADMTASQKLRDGTVVPPQFDALSEDTDLVTVSLGGNEFDVYWTFLYKCTLIVNTDPDGAPCRKANHGSVEKHMDEIRANLTDVIDQIGQFAPNAKVVFVGYPRLLPDKGGCPRRVPVAKGDVDYVREMMDLLIQAQYEAAETAKVDFVDLYTPSEGHDICSSSPWVNDATDGPQGAYNFHPMPALQTAITHRVLEIL
jgi:hypothetical protein